MGLFDKVKGLFTDEEEIPVTREVKYSEKKSEEKINPIKKEEKVSKKEEKIEVKAEKKPEEEKFVFFDDEDFEDIKHKEFAVEKPMITNKVKQPYGMSSKAYGSIGKPKVEEKKRFTPSLIISPIYGVLDKDYKKEELKPVNVSSRVKNKDLTLDDVRQKAFSSLEDDLRNNLFSDEIVEEKIVVIEDELNMFDEPKVDVVVSEEITAPISTDSLYDDVLEEDTLYLSKKLEEQQKKLDEINELIKNESFGTNLKEEINDLKEELSDTKKTVKKNKKSIKEVKEDVEENEEAIDEIEEKIEPVEEDFDLLDNEEEKEIKSTNIDDAFNETIGTIKPKDDMSESELFNLIDSMYEGDE